MKDKLNPLIQVIVASWVASAASIQAANQFWNPSPLSDNWANSVWSATSGGGPLTTWTASNDAIFDQAGTYTATINADQTATNLNIKAGTVTFAGTNVVSSTNLTIDSGATLSGAGDRYLKAAATTALTVNGTLDMTALTLTSRRVSIAGGSGNIILGGASAIRMGGAITFAGNISGTGALVTDAGGTIDLSGNNTYSGDTLIRSGNILRLGSSTALSANSFLRLGAGTNIAELTTGNFSRTVSATTFAGTVRFSGTGDAVGIAGFAAVGADRTVALNGTVKWDTTIVSTTVLGSSALQLGSAASTHKVTLTTGIDLGAGSRTITSTNGAAALEGEISGNLTNGTLNITGTGNLKLSGTNTLVTLNKGAAGTDTGTLILSGTNTFSTATLTYGTAGQNRGAIRLESNTALGGVTAINGVSGTGNAQARIELANNVTITGITYGAGGRNNQTTTGASIVNISGDNEWAGTIRITGAGGNYGIRSDAGTLKLSGSLQNTIATDRTWDIAGAGDTLISGTIINNGANGLAINKVDAGKLTITGNSNTYTLGTTVAAGTLLANNATGSATGTGAVSVTGGTLGGTGSISGAVTIGALGKLSPTAQASGSKLSLGSTLAFDAGATSIFNWDLSAANTPDPGVVPNNGDYGQVAVTGAVTNTAIFNIALLGGPGKTTSYADAFWNTNKSWDNVFASSVTDLTTLFTSFTGTGLTPSGFGGSAIATATGEGYFGFTSTTLTWTAVPEPTSALAGILLGFGLLRRRR